MRPAPRLLAASSLVAAGMLAMNAVIYLFNVVSAHLMVPAEFGALTALLGIILVGTVAAVGLQATTARRLAVAPEHAGEIIHTTARVTIAVALAVSAVVAASTVLLTPALKLDSHWPVILCGLTLAPLTIMGAQSGVAQGGEHWRTLTAIYLANGVGRVVGGTTSVLITPTSTAAMLGIAIGAWLPVVAGARMLLAHRRSGHHLSPRSFLREATLSAHSLLAYFVLSNMDALIARNRFDVHDSGLYASGLILAKAALFLPQFVSVVFYPELARSTTRHARWRAVTIVAGFGALAVVAAAALPRLALVFVGGDDYAEIADRLWLFALAGSALAIVHLLLFDALARHAHGIVVMIWTAVAALFAVAYGLDVDITGLVVAVGAVALTLAVAIWLAPVGKGGRMSRTQ